MRLNWSRLLFFLGKKRRRKTRFIGSDLYATCRFNGKYMIVDGLCLGIRSAKLGLLISSINIRRFDAGTNYYLKFPVFLGGAYNFFVSGITYGYKVNCSKLAKSRIKK